MRTGEKVSVIIPTKDRPIFLKNCLESLLVQSVLPDEIVVVDNSSKQSAKEIVEFFQKKYPKIHYYHITKDGSPFARNFGISKALHDLLAFIDDDCIADKDWLLRLLKAQKNHPGTVMKGKNLNGNTQNLFATIEHFSAEVTFLCHIYRKNSTLNLQMVDSKNFSIRKSVLEKYHLRFDTAYAPYSIFEDITLSHLLRKYQIPIIYNPNMIVWHYPRSSVIQHFSREMRKGRARCYFEKKWKLHNERRLISQFISTRGPQSKRVMERDRSIVAIQRKLKEECLKNRSIFFIIAFYGVFGISRLINQAGYIYEHFVLSYKKN